MSHVVGWWRPLSQCCRLRHPPRCSSTSNQTQDWPKERKPSEGVVLEERQWEELLLILLLLSSSLAASRAIARASSRKQGKREPAPVAIPAGPSYVAFIPLPLTLPPSISLPLNNVSHVLAQSFKFLPPKLNLNLTLASEPAESTSLASVGSRSGSRRCFGWLLLEAGWYLAQMEPLVWLL